jgi:hypothetical protein
VPVSVSVFFTKFPQDDETQYDGGHRLSIL